MKTVFRLFRFFRCRHVTCIRATIRRLHGRFFRILPLIVGLFSLAWFLIRVLPKPSRAAYPCQRAAFPLASGFVIWTAGTVSSWLVLKKSKHLFQSARPVLALAMFFVALFTAAFAAYYTPVSLTDAAIYPGELASAPQMAPNDPIGNPDGFSPGRVVWVHDPDATDWNGTGNWLYDSDTDQNIVDQMLADAIRWLTGELAEQQAWDVMFHHFNLTRGKGDIGYQSTEEINIKINLVTCIAYAGRVSSSGEQLSYLNDVSVSKELVLALLRQLVYQAGVPPQQITVGDTTAVMPDHYYNYWAAEFPNVVYLTAPEYSLTGRTMTRYPDPGMGEDEHFVYWSKPGVMTDPSLNDDRMPVSYSEADYFINFPTMKTHQPGFTLCGKNLFGAFLRFPTDWAGHYDYFNWHDDQGRMGTEPGVNDVAHYRPQVDMLGHIDIDGKNILNIIDALWTGYNWGDCSPPLPWRSAPFNGDYMSSILVSQDVVAIDSVAHDFWWAEDDASAAWFPFVDGCGGGGQAHQPRQRGADDYLIDAAIHENADPERPAYFRYNESGDVVPMPSLGVHERWNNAADKQYSRNLGTGDGIELVTHEYFNIYYTDMPPDVTDGGVIDSVWDDIRPRYCMREVHQGATPAELEDFSGFFKALWDEDYLYLYVEITDERPLHDSPVITYWLNDNVELFLDAGYDSYDRTTYDGVNDFEYGFCWNDPVAYTGNNSVHDTTGVIFQTVTTATGWRLEAAVPWQTTLGESPLRADFIGFDLHLTDDDTDNPPDTRDNKLAWYATWDDSWINPSLFAKVMLDGFPPDVPTGDQPPAAPSELAGAFITSSRVDLSWIDNASDEDGFTIQRKVGSGDYSQLIDLPVDTTSYSDTTATAGTTYMYRIYAWNTYGDSFFSNELSVVAESPVAPVGLAALTDDNRVTLEWTCNTEPNVLYYVIDRSTSQTTGFKAVAVAFQACHITDYRVVNGTTYYYRIMAVNTLGLQSGYSSTVSVNPGPQPPLPPTGLAAVAGDGWIDLTWSANTEPDLSHYRVYRSLDEGSGYTLRAQVYTGQDYSDTSVTNGITYYYRITSVDIGSQESGYSNTASATPQANQPPMAPTNLAASAVSSTVIDLTWQDNAMDETGFKIERKTGGGGFNEILTLSADMTSVSDTGLTPGTVYTYRIRAYNSYGHSPYSNEAGDTTPFNPFDADIIYTTTIPDVTDGVIDAVWSGVSSQVIDNDVFTPVIVCSGQWRALWTDNAFYMLVEVTDNTLHKDSPDSQWWKDDSIEIFIDADNSKDGTYDGVNDFQYGLRYNDGTVRIGTNSVNQSTGIEFSIVETGQGYRLEIKIPWSTLLGMTPSADDLIGLEVHINDDDDGGDRDAKVAWYGDHDDCWHDPSTFATVRLSD